MYGAYRAAQFRDEFVAREESDAAFMDEMGAEVIEPQNQITSLFSLALSIHRSAIKAVQIACAQIAGCEPLANTLFTGMTCGKVMSMIVETYYDFMGNDDAKLRAIASTPVYFWCNMQGYKVRTPAC